MNCDEVEYFTTAGTPNISYPTSTLLELVDITT